MTHFIQNVLPALKADLSKAKTWYKAVLYPTLVGGATAVLTFLQNIGHEEQLLTHQGLQLLKTKFLIGAGGAFLTLFIKSPLKHTDEVTKP